MAENVGYASVYCELDWLIYDVHWPTDCRDDWKAEWMHWLYERTNERMGEWMNEGMNDTCTH